VSPMSMKAGHAKQGELQTLLALARRSSSFLSTASTPLLRHARLAIEMGVDRHNVLLCEDGDQVSLNAEGLEFDGEVPAGYLFVDGIVGDIRPGRTQGPPDPRREGVVVVVVGVDEHTGRSSRPGDRHPGWIHAEEAEELLEEARGVVSSPLPTPSPLASSTADTLRRVTRAARSASW